MADRKLTALDATLLVMGGIVGVGIFYTPSTVARLVPEPAAYLALWGFGGVIALAGATTFAELGGTFPRAGGWYVFLREAFGRLVAFLFAWVVLAVISTGATAVMAEICVANLSALVPGIGAPDTAGGRIAGALLIAGVTALALGGAKAGATFQNACMLIKLGAIGVLAVGGLVLWRADGAAALPAADLAAEAPPLAEGLVRALLPVLFACGGWQMVCYVAPAVRDPERTLPRAIVIGILAVVAVYLAINAAYLRVLGTDGLAADPGGFAGTMAREVLGPGGGRILQGAIAVSALGVCTVTLIVTPWLYVAMAGEGLFFRRFERLSPRTGAPRDALLVQAALCLFWWFQGRAGVLVDAVVFVEWIFHLLAAAALLRLRAKRPDLPRPFASWLYPLAPVAYLLFAALVVAGNVAWARPSETGMGLVVIAVGLVVYRPWRSLVARSERRARPA